MQEYKISGVSVLFPCKPYPSQFSMMDKIIKGIQRRQNCLIESPTGSGKSLALLCSALAWQLAEKAKQELEETEEPETNVCTCTHVKASSSSPVKATLEANCLEGKQLSELAGVPEHKDDDDDFKSAGKAANLQGAKRKPKKHIVVVYDSDEDVAAGTDRTLKEPGTPLKAKPDQNTSPQSTCVCNCMGGAERKPKAKISKIYFGTRTHKQVAQIVRELRKTGYHDVRMTVLGSREHTCIHPQVSRTKKKNDACKELLNDQGCHFKDSTGRLSSQNAVKSFGLSTAWDLEDLVTFCKTKRACPYFLSRALKEDSDLIICPYNYLVDPIVRDAMQISLKGHVVILDEAHNIEDSAREAASQSLTQDSILKAIWDIESLMEANINLADHSKLRSMLKNLDMFIDANKSTLEQKEYDRSYKIWTGFNIVAQLETLGLGPRQFPEYKEALASVKSDAEAAKDAATRSGRSKELVEMKPATQTVLGQMFQILDYLYRMDLKYVDDYRASLVQMFSYVPLTNDNQWLNSRSANGGRTQVQVDVYTLNFWCMNPGVAFSDFSETRSIILTSGTLSPMSSFQSELGLEFKIQLETNHVIEDSQVWVGTLGRGPSGSTLQAVFRNLETFTFQDELGNLVLKVCQIVPHGVLCFLPSYNVLDKLMKRWESTGLKRKLDQCKMVIREPKNSDKLNFEDQLNQFYEALTPQADGVKGTDTDGAIFFAVCRGKVSEGLDFADNFARAVITVGVPYPNFKDVQVELKRKYNDQHRQSRGLLSGSEWYEIQAFRALNQALGRCIRHKHDWGALIIVDDRFVRTAEKYCKGLSKWVRNKIHTYQDCSVAMESLSKFTAGQLAVQDSRVSQDASLVKSPELKVTSKLAAELGSTVSSPLTLSPDFSGMDIKTSAKMMDVRTPAKPFPIFSMGSSVRPRASPVSSMEKQQAARNTARRRHQRASFPLAVVNTDSDISVSEVAPATAYCHDKDGLAHDAGFTKDPVTLTATSVSAMTDNLSSTRISTPQTASSEASAPIISGVPLDSQTDSTDKLASCITAPGWQSGGATPVGQRTLVAGSRPVASSKKFLFRRSHADNQSPAGPVSEEMFVSSTDTSLLVSTNKLVPVAQDTPISRISVPVSQDTLILPTDTSPPVFKSELPSLPTPLSKNKSISPTPESKENSMSTTPLSKSQFPTYTSTPESKENFMSPTPILKSQLPTHVSTPVSKDKSISPTPENSLSPTPLSKSKLPTYMSTPVSEENSISPTCISPSPLLCKKSTPGLNSADRKSGGQQESEDRLLVRRKKRGTKRKYTSKSAIGTIARKEEKTACEKQAKIAMVCSLCDCLLVPGVDKSDFQEQRSVPSFLRECDPCPTNGCVFFPGNTGCGPLCDIKGSMEGVYTKYNEQEEICVQFLYCGQCLKASPHSTPAVGAEVKLAAGSGARFSKGQMWLFLGAVTLREVQ